jgi:hypothetical protein
VPLTLERALLTHLSQTKEKYFALIEKHVDQLKAKGVAVSADMIDAVTSAIAEGRALAADKASVVHAAVLDKVSAAWERLLSVPAVASLLETAKPSVHSAYETAKAKATSAASYVCAQPAFTKHVQPRMDKLAAQPAVSALIERARPVMAAF